MLGKRGLKLAPLIDTGSWMDRKTFNELAYSGYADNSLTERRFYNIGAGNFLHPYWTNVDMPSEWYSSDQSDFVPYNIESKEPLPIENDSAEAVYTSHTIEHVSDDAVSYLFREIHRIMKPGAMLRVTCPDIDLAYNAWRANDPLFYYWRDNYSRREEMERAKYLVPANSQPLGQMFLRHFASSASPLHIGVDKRPIDTDELEIIFSKNTYEEALDICKSRTHPCLQAKNPGWHINWWNIDKVRHSLESSGFAEIYQSGWGQSRCPPMRDTSLFDKTHPKMSLFIEAKK